jgi:hypothetical protein
MTNILLKHSSYQFEITSKQASILSELSELIKLCKSETPSTDVIFIPDYITKKSMLNIIEFCDMFNDPLDEILWPLTHKKFQNSVGDDIYVWLLLFNNRSLFELLNSANCLCIEPLVEIICLKICLDIKEMNLDDAKNYFKCG